MDSLFSEIDINEWYLFSLFFLSIILLIFFSELSLKKNIWPNHINRKIIHISVGIAVSLSPYIFTSRLKPCILALIFFTINLISYRKNRLNSFHLIERDSYGTIFFPLSYLLLASLFWDYPNHITASFLILAIADPISSIIGSLNKKNKSYNILGDNKTLEGSTAMFLCSTIILSLLSQLIFNDFGISLQIIAIITTSIAITISEGLSYKGSDNLTIPITAFLFIELFNHLNKINFVSEFLFIITLIVLSLFTFYTKKHLSISGFIGASLMAVLLFGFGGYSYTYPIVVFFITSTILSFIKNQHSEIKKSDRTINQVYATGGIALSICILNYFFSHSLMYPCFLASVAAANSDTWGTEIGKKSNKKPIDIISGNTVSEGVSGGITLYGNIGSIIGSILIGIIGYYFLRDIKIISLIIISGFISSIFDSILGSSVQARYISPEGLIITEEYKKSYYLYTGSKQVNNDIVNLCCTISGPLIFLIIHSII